MHKKAWADRLDSSYSGGMYRVARRVNVVHVSEGVLPLTREHPSWGTLKLDVTLPVCGVRDDQGDRGC